MTRDEFEEIRRLQDYGAPKEVRFEPNSKSETHTHDLISFVYVLEGEFILNTEDGAPSYAPGETVLLAPNVPHAEEAGPAGATILVARK